MENAKTVAEKLNTGFFDEKLKKMYCCDENKLLFYRKRFIDAINEFENLYGSDKDIALFSAPGRTEIGGNHTDHQNGHVLCASINLDVIAVVAKNGTSIIKLKSEGYPLSQIDITETNPLENEYGSADALIRGVASKFSDYGYEISGFDAYTTSSVLKGSGLSSSAAFEILLGNICNDIFADSTFSPIELARIGQYAENVFFGKPCGLMDQMACSVGGIISIDFAAPGANMVEKTDFDFPKSGYALCIIDSGADHADLTDEYAAIPLEMKEVASFFEKNILSEVSEDEFYQNIAKLREKCSDRAVLRAIHFFEDDKRVSRQSQALKNNDMNKFLSEVNSSGRSSFMYLQNVIASGEKQNQAVALTLALCEKFLSGKGAFRVHGGGFAGTVQAFVPVDILSEFKENIEKILGKDKCYIMSIRPVGGIKL